ncbi:endo-1,5-alpha-L-arabinosidase [Tothia fuscella]|uniref:Arabinan endo-1,5-alpha-L-arabinosidase n=1 Tax=Tothia fuscella TaxID=1048955 RepID=A0A9P4P627_9PEZI|nr:endo-1,5-alpha-L-arabinosidase [Tothia fuscella]
MFALTTIWPLVIAIASALTTSNPFSQSNWPLPHNITGTDTPGQWGGVHLHDPSIVQGPDGAYYSFSTHGLVSISRAVSLDGYWEHIGSVLTRQSIIDLPGRNDTWAPDVSKIGNTYYCYYSISTFGSQNSAIGLATSQTLLPGSWTDHGAVLESGKDKRYPLNATNGIDANIFVDEKSGEVFLNYGSFWSDIWQFKLLKDLKGLDWSWPPKQLSFEPKGTNPEEGASISENKGWYYLWVSHGVCCGFNTTLPVKGEEYEILVGRSKTHYGPFVDREGKDMKNGGGSVVYGSHEYVYGPGGQGVLKNYNGRDVLYFHYVPTYVSYIDEDKRLGWDYIEYVDGWPVLVY